MIYWKKKDSLDARALKAQARVKKLSTSDLPGWAEQAMMETGRAFHDWNHQGAAESLEDAIVGAEAVLAVLRELKARY